jgi:hypothetical protein
MRKTLNVNSSRKDIFCFSPLTLTAGAEEKGCIRYKWTRYMTYGEEMVELN